MPKLMIKAIRYGRIDGRIDSDYRKASLLKTKIRDSTNKSRVDKVSLLWQNKKYVSYFENYNLDIK